LTPLIELGQRLARFSRSGLLAHESFRRLWISLWVTSFGGQVSRLALPLSAALLLNATPFQMGLLIALETLPFALIGLPAGVWVDRYRQLTLVVACNIFATAALMVVPIAAWMGWLSMTVLYVVGFAVGCVHVLGGSAYQVLMTRLVGRPNLVEANARIALANSSAEVVGPGLAGTLIQLLTAPFAIALDALSYLYSALILKGVDDRHLAPVPSAGNMWQQIREGLALVWRQPLLRALAWTVALWQFLNHVYQSVIILFAARELALSPAVVGLVYMMSGLGCLLGASLAERVTKRFGVGAVIVGGLALTGAAWEMLPFIAPTSQVAAGALTNIASGAPTMVSPLARTLTPGEQTLAATLLGLGLFTFGFGATIFVVNYLALRQAVTPDHLLGRMTSSMRSITVAAAPLGSLAGGAMATLIGLAETLAVTGLLGMILAFVMIWATPLAAVKQLPPPDDFDYERD
jgi:MFS family permease